MNCQKAKEKFADFLTGDLDEKSHQEIRSHLASCPACRLELESLSAIWTKLGVLPAEQPTPGLRQRFYGMLEAYKDGMEKEKPRRNFFEAFTEWTARFMPRRPVYQFAFSFLLLVVGLTAGFFAGGVRFESGEEIASLRQEVSEMRQMAAVSLLNQPSASERLRGVNFTSRLEQPTEGTLLALLDTLNNDPNISVRLAAVDALYLFYDHPQVKEGLVNSLETQTSPLVQISLIDLLVEIRERRAAEALRLLIQDERLNPEVKKRAEQGLARLS